MEIAQEAEVPYPTAVRIVQTLQFEGLIEREPARKRYRPTALVHTLSRGFQGHDWLVAAARRPMVNLTRAVGWPVSLTTRVGPIMMVRDSTHSLSPLTFNNSYPNDKLPLLESAAGRVYLAFITEEERQQILSGLRQRGDLESGAARMLSLFESGFMVDEVRSRGFATQGSHSRLTNSGKTSSIAVPLFEDGEVVGALSLFFFSSAKRTDDAVRDYGPELKAAAAKVREALDCRPTSPPYPLRVA